MGSKEVKTDAERKSGAVWKLLIFLTIIVIFLSLWYYSGLVGEGIGDLFGSIWNDMTNS